MLAAAPAHAGDALPNPALTPGAIATSDPALICAPGYARTHRHWHGKRQTLAKYNIPWLQAGNFEDDDLIPVCLGGDNADPRNHWPQYDVEASHKDWIEGTVCRSVCWQHADRQTIEGWQRWFATGDWAR